VTYQAVKQYLVGVTEQQLSEMPYRSLQLRPSRMAAAASG
jgi:hypothetical protein